MRKFLIRVSLSVGVLFLAVSCARNSKPLQMVGGQGGNPVEIPNEPVEEVAKTLTCQVSGLPAGQTIPIQYDAAGVALEEKVFAATVNAFLDGTPVANRVMSVTDYISLGAELGDAVPTTSQLQNSIHIKMRPTFQTALTEEHRLTFTVSDGTHTGKCDVSFTLRKAVQPVGALITLLDANGIPDSINLAYGAPFTLNWTVSNVTHCKRFDYELNALPTAAALAALDIQTPTSKSLTVVPLVTNSGNIPSLPANKAYFVGCEKVVNGTSVGRTFASVLVTMAPAPTISSFSVTKADGSAISGSLAVGTNLRVDVSAVGVASCSILADNVVVVTGSVFPLVLSAYPLVQSTQFKATCKNGAAAVVASSSVVTVSVNAPQTSSTPTPTPIVVQSFTVTYGTTVSSSRVSNVPYGQAVTLKWGVLNATQCSVGRDDQWAPNGALATTLSSTGTSSGSLFSGMTRFTLRCTQQGNPLPLEQDLFADVLEPIDNEIFVSEGSTVGAMQEEVGGNTILGGFAGDAKCTKWAGAVGLRKDRPWKAVLSTDAERANRRITIFGRVYNKGNLIGDTDGAFWTNKDWGNAIAYNERGLLMSSSDHVWTGIERDGFRAANDCNSWRDNTGTGRYGIPTESDIDRINRNDEKCNISNHIYCISQ